MGKASKDRRDIYYRKAKEQGWRARSAFKLLQIDLKYKLLENVTKVVDLCAAPGSWSQVLSQKLYPDQNFLNDNITIVAVDLQPMAPIPGVIQIQGDITKASTTEQVLTHFGGDKADLVVCDGAPDGKYLYVCVCFTILFTVFGLHSMDVYIQWQLVLSALKTACKVLKPGGNFVAKLYRSKNTDTLTNQFLKLFKSVEIAKPMCSRNSSIEAFIVCLNYSLGKFSVDDIKLFESGCEKNLIPCTACGEADAFDSDATYSLQLQGEEKYQYRDPVQAPIAPPYYFAKDQL